jgi:hypothetical protein
MILSLRKLAFPLGLHSHFYFSPVFPKIYAVVRKIQSLTMVQMTGNGISRPGIGGRTLFSLKKNIILTNFLILLAIFSYSHSFSVRKKMNPRLRSLDTVS